MKAGRHTLLTAIAVGVLFIAYSGWVAYVYRFDRALDFYVYYIAGHLMSVGRDAYTIAPPDWVETAGHLEIANFTLPYRYPPHTAAMVALLQPLGPHRAMLVWGGANSVAMVAGALLVG